MSDGKLSMSSFISVMVPDRLFLIISHRSRSHRYVLFSVSRSLLSK